MSASLFQPTRSFVLFFLAVSAVNSLLVVPSLSRSYYKTAYRPADPCSSHCPPFQRHSRASTFAFSSKSVESSPNAYKGKDVRNRQPTYNNIQKRNYNRKPSAKRWGRQKIEEVKASDKWQHAQLIEKEVIVSLERLQHATKDDTDIADAARPTSFPTIRDCNAALATFGDGDDLLRALRMFGKMKKASALVQKHYGDGYVPFSVCTPTMVTYSTIMSRAVHLGKPEVALRLWKLMRAQKQFFASPTKDAKRSVILPDVKAANILMNCYAKLGDLDSALGLLLQMRSAKGGADVPRMKPNIVTYNTLMDACQKAGNLDTAMETYSSLLEDGLHPDIRTFTTMIATVARKVSAISGANDPTLAFSFLEDMKKRNIRPNGMTYSALIDVCGRCQRSDLALKGLRMMMDQKAQEQKTFLKNLNAQARDFVLPNEVGAWTAAINACGKAGRIDTAIKLFYSMPNYGVSPNAVTCGCLTDCLLRNRRTSETLDVLRYMKKYNIAPTEVMYTSLMTSASKLVQYENKRQHVRTTFAPVQPTKQQSSNSFPVDKSGGAKAIEVYTELIMSLSQQGVGSKKKQLVSPFSKGGDDPDEVLRVFLVFQEMKAVGARPDLACYNALLKACAAAGDVDRAQKVLNDILSSEGMDPNDVSYREMIRAAGRAKRSDIAISTWRSAVRHRADNEGKPDVSLWTPSIETFGVLIMTIVRSASETTILDDHTRRGLFQFLVNLYRSILSSSPNHLMGMDLMNKDAVMGEQRVMLVFLQAVVSLERMLSVEHKSSGDGEVAKKIEQLRIIGISIVTLSCFADGLAQGVRNNHIYRRAFQIGHDWSKRQTSLRK